LAGLILSKNPFLSHDQVRNIILSTADTSIYALPGNVAFAGKLGTGRVNVGNAMATVGVPQSSLDIVQKLAVDDGGNGQINSGETIRLTIGLRNAGFTATNVQAELSSTASNVAVTGGHSQSSYGTMTYGQTKTNAATPFWFVVSGTVPAAIPLTLTLTGDGGYTQTIDFNVDNSIFYSGNIFHDIQAGLPLLWDTNLAWGDYDNDGRLDLVLAGDMNVRIARVYRNEGPGLDGEYDFNNTFSYAGSYMEDVTWVDFDNDGYLDLVRSGSGQTKIFRNRGMAANYFNAQPDIILPSG
jgi:hypothetical protein